MLSSSGGAEEDLWKRLLEEVPARQGREADDQHSGEEGALGYCSSRRQGKREGGGEEDKKKMGSVCLD